MADDFFVKFDSNAATWARQLRSELAPAYDEIERLQNALNGLQAPTGGSSPRRAPGATSPAPGAPAPQRRVDNGGGGTVTPQQRAMLEAAARAGGGRAVTGGNLDVNKLQDAFDSLSDESRAIADSLKSSAVDIVRTVQQIKAIPDAIEGTFKSVRTTLDRIAEESRGQGRFYDPRSGAITRAGTPGSIQRGGDQDRVLTQIREALRTGTLARPNPELHFAPTAVGIGGIGTKALDKANFDRVILAIRAQTRVLQSSGVKIQGSGASPATAAAVTTVSDARRDPKTKGATDAAKKAGDSLERTVDQLEASFTALSAQVDEENEKIARLAAIIKEKKGAGEDTSELDAVLAQQRTMQAEKAKVLAATEREITGKTRGDQADERRAKSAAARTDVPTITDAEKADRERRRAAIASAGAADFTERSTGQAKKGSGRYTEADLREMVAAYRSVGIQVAATAKSTKKELVGALQEANKAYRSAFPEGSEELRTQGFNVEKTTKVDNATTKLVGSMEELRRDADELGKALDIISADRRGGGDKYRRASRLNDEARAPGDLTGSLANSGLVAINRYGVRGQDPTSPKGGNIMVPPGMVKGRRGAGSGLGDLYTEEDYRKAAESLGPNPARMREAALRLSQEPGFDPYDVQHGRNIKSGNTPDERRLAQAAQSRLRDLRLATAQIDAQAVKYRELAAAEKDALDYQKNIQGDLAILASTPTRPGTDEDDYRNSRQDELRGSEKAAETELRNIRAELAKIPAELKSVFDSPEFSRGLDVREGLNGAGYAPNLGSRQVAEARSNYYQDRTKTISDYALVREGLAGGIAGGQTGIGQRGFVRNTPGIRQVGDRIVAENASKRQQEKLDVATGDVARSLLAYQDAIKKSAGALPTTEAAGAVNEAADELEKAVNTLANRIARFGGSGLDANNKVVGGGLAPSFESIAGFAPRGDKARRDELRRQEARDAADANRKNKNKPETEEGKAAQAQLALDNTKSRLKKALDRQATATDNLTKREEELDKVFQSLSRAEQEEVRAAEARLAGLVRQRNSLENIRSLEAANTRAPLTASTDLSAERAQLAALQRQRNAAKGNATKARNAYENAPDDISTAVRKRFIDKIRDTERKFQSLDAQVTSLANQIKNTKITYTAGGSGEKMDTQGYASKLGYFPDVQDERDRLDAEISRAREQRNKVVPVDPNADAEEKRTREELARRIAARQGIINKISAAREEGDLKENAGYHAARDEQGLNEARISKLTAQLDQASGLDAFENLVKEAAQADAEVDRLTKEVAELGTATVATTKKVQQATKAKKDEGAAEAATLTKAQQNRINKLGKERETLKAAGPHTAAEIKKLQEGGASAEDVKAAKDAKRRIGEIRREIDGIRTAAGIGGGRSGGGRPPTAQGGARGGNGGGNYGNILGRILAKLNQIHTAVARGIKVNVGRAPASTPRAPRTPTVDPVTGETVAPKPRAGSRSPEERARKDAIAAKRRALEDTAAQRRLDEQVQREADAAEKSKFRAARQRTAADSKAEAAIRQQVRAAQDLKDAQAALSTSTNAEIEKLQQLARAAAEATDEQEKLAAQSALSAQQTKVYGLVDDELRSKEISATDRRSAAGTVLRSASPDLGAQELDSIRRSTRSARGFRGAGEEAAQEFQSGFGALFGQSGFYSRVVASTGTFLVRNFTAGLVFGLTGALQDVLDQAIQTEATFVRVSAALESSNKEIGNLRGDLQDISTDYGVALNDVYETAAGLSGLFENAGDLAAGTRVVAQLQTISGGALNANEAMGILASTMSAFEALPGEDLTDKLLPGGIEGVQKIADVLTVVQNTLGTNVETTSEGVSRMAGLARQMQLSFEETAVFTAQIAKQTNQTGAGAGEQFSRILATLQTGRGRGAVLDAYNAGAGGNAITGQQQAAVEGALATGDYGEVIKLMIANWDNLSEAQQRNVATSVAGQRQAAAFNALMNNSTKTLTALSKAEDANGEAADRMAALMDTLNKRLDVLQTQAQNLASNLVRTGILNFLGVVLVVTNTLLGSVNKVLTAFNDFADNTPLLGFLRTMITMLLGAGLAFKLLQTGITGIRGAVRGAVPAGATQAIAEQRAAQQASRLAAGGAPGRPDFRTYGGRGTDPNASRRAPLSRLAGFGVDRTFGIAADAAARGARQLNNRFGSTEQGATRLQRGLGRAAQGATSFAERLRTAAQNFGSGNRTGFGANLASRASVGLAFRADERLSAARQSREIYAQQQAASVSPAARAAQQRDLARQGFSPAEVRTRTSAPDSNLIRQARVQEALGRATGGASRTMAGMSNTLTRLGQTGALADGAMIGVTVAISALLAELNRNSQIKAQNRSNFKQVFGEDRGKSLAEQADEYIGKFSEDFEKTQNEIRDANVFQNGYRGLGAVLAGGDFTLPGIQRSLRGRVGADANGGGFTQGYDESTQLLEDTRRRLELAATAPGATGESIRMVQEQVGKTIRERAAEIQADSSLSVTQKQAALANLEATGKFIADDTANLAAVADGVNSTLGMSADQVAKVQEAVQAFQSIGGLNSLGGLRLDDITAGLIDDTGAADGSEAKRLLEKMRDGSSDTVDIQVMNIRLLREGLINLENSLATKLEQGAPPEETDAIRSQLLQQLAALGQASDQAVSAVLEQANAVSAGLSDEGNIDQSNKAWNAAMDRATRIYKREAEGAISAAQEAANARKAQEANAEAMQAAFDKLDPSEQEAFQDGGIGSLLNPYDAEKPMPRWKKRFGPYVPGSPATQGFAPPKGLDPDNDAAIREQNRANRAPLVQNVRDRVQTIIQNETRELRVEKSKTKNNKAKSFIDQKIAQITNDILARVNAGLPVDGLSAENAQLYGNAAVSEEEIAQTQIDFNTAQIEYTQSSKDAANQAAQDAAAIKQAQAGLAGAYADARGDAVASARAGVLAAKAALQAARAQLANATTDSEMSQARAAILSAQAGLVAANAAVSDAQSDLVQSRYEVSIAIAEAAGNTVLAAKRTLEAARVALRTALKQSGGAMTAEVNRAKAQAIQAEAALRDARLQDQLDTIDFNLQMGKITSASAITALQQILKTSDLTKQQRRQLLLQIKGMKDEMADSQFNFGAIKLPTPYEVRRYGQQQLQAAAAEGAANARNLGREGRPQSGAAMAGMSVGGSTTTTTTNQTTIQINGGDLRQIRKVVEDVVGRPSRTTTTAPRRRI